MSFKTQGHLEEPVIGVKTGFPTLVGGTVNFPKPKPLIFR